MSTLVADPQTLSTADIEHVRSDARDLVSELKRVVQGEVRFDGYSRMLYSTDASQYQIQPVGVVIPQRVEDVQATVEIARRHGVPVLPRGGGSSLAGQAVGAAVVIDFSKYMNGVVDVDPEARAVTVQPGINFTALNRQMAGHGLMIGPDPASANRATIGGSIGNNATGSHSILYGMMADNVHSVSAILSDGSAARFAPMTREELEAKARSESLEGHIYREVPRIIHGVMEELLERWPKHWRRASGYNLDRLAAALLPPEERVKLSFDSRFRPPVCDPMLIERFNLAQIFTGSEGTLGVMTEATVKLVSKPRVTGLAVIHFDRLIDSCAAIPDILETDPSASELLDKMLMDLARAQPEWAKRMHFVEGDPEAVLLTEYYGDSEREVAGKLERLESHLRSRGWNGTVLRITDPVRQNDIWEVRKAGLNILMSRRSDYKAIPGIEDVSVPQEQLAEYLEQVLDFCSTQDDIPDVAVYAHASAGCLHVRPLINLKHQKGVDTIAAVCNFAADLAVKYRGAMSGEHGDGLARSELNPRIFGENLYGALQDVKRTFDPDNLMNPGKVVNAPSMAENLRFGPTYQTIELDTVFDWSPDHGFATAIEMCNGAGVCRKLDSGTMCPSYMATRDERDTTRARANSLRNVLAGRIPKDELYGEGMYEVMDLCLGCKACKSECPSAVDLAKIKAEFLVHYYRENGLPLFNRLMGLLPTLNELLYKLAAPLVPLVNWSMETAAFKSVMEKVGVHPARQLPTYARETFESWFRKHGDSTNTLGAAGLAPSAQRMEGGGTAEREAQKIDPESAAVAPQDLPGDQTEFTHAETVTNTVILFHDTWSNYNEPHVAQAAVRVLEAAGYRVQLADGRKCCGRPLMTGGQADRAKAWVDHNVALLAPHANLGIPIVGIEPSCILTLRDEYLNLASDTRRARILADHAFTLEEFIVQEMEAGRFQPQWKAEPGKALLHGHCHHKALVGNETSVTALRAAGYSVEVIPSGCCGMAGDFGYETGHYEVSRQIGEDRLFPAVRAAAVDTVVVASGTSCRHQIEHFVGRHPVHLAEALALAIEGS